MPRKNGNAQRKRKKLRNTVRPSGRCWQTGKYGYKTEPEATAALADIREKRISAGADEDQLEKRVYHHKVCDRWHLTKESDAQYIANREAHERGDQAE